MKNLSILPEYYWLCFIPIGILALIIIVHVYKLKMQMESIEVYPRKFREILWDDFWSLLNIRTLGILLLIIAIVSALLGFKNQYGSFQIDLFVIEYYANISTELGGIAITILLVDYLYRRQSNKELKKQLIREMSSHDNGIAVRAVNELRAYGWLEDGSLKNSSFSDANLSGADLRGADLTGAKFNHSNLQGANLSKVNLAKTILLDVNLTMANISYANLHGLNSYIAGMSNNNESINRVNDTLLQNALSLSHSIMPDGRKYNGRYNLKGDLEIIREWNFRNVDVNTPEGMAISYGVTLEDYLNGQKWYEDNLKKPKNNSTSTIQKSHSHIAQKSIGFIIFTAVILFLQYLKKYLNENS